MKANKTSTIADVFCAEVTVTALNGIDHHFLIFFTSGKKLPDNRALDRAHPGCGWKGDILVMRCGINIDGPVNLRAGDDMLLDFAVQKQAIFIFSLIFFLKLTPCLEPLKTLLSGIQRRLSFQTTKIWFSQCRTSRSLLPEAGSSFCPSVLPQLQLGH